MNINGTDYTIIPEEVTWLPLRHPHITWREMRPPISKPWLYRPSQTLAAQVAKATVILQENMRHVLGDYYILYSPRQIELDWEE